MLSWRHTGFHVHVGARIWPEAETVLGNLAKYIVRASFSQERMLYISAEKSADGSAKVVYQSKDGKTEQTFDAIGWLASLVVHIPSKYEQWVRHLEFYSKKSRGMRNKSGNRRCDTVDCARRIEVETVPPQPGEAASKNVAEEGGHQLKSRL